MQFTAVLRGRKRKPIFGKFSWKTKKHSSCCCCCCCFDANFSVNKSEPTWHQILKKMLWSRPCNSDNWSKNCLYYITIGFTGWAAERWFFWSNNRIYGLELCGSDWEETNNFPFYQTQSVLSAPVQVQDVMFVFLRKTNRAIRVFFNDEKHIFTINTSKLM